MVVQIQEIRAIHANLKEQFPNICLAEPLSYINMLVGSVHECFVPHQPVLLLCKKIPPILTNDFMISPPKRPKLFDTINASEFMGSPLKDNCKIEVMDESLRAVVAPRNFWTNEEECLTGIPLADAQHALATIELAFKTEKKCPVWAICQPNEQHILLQFQILDSNRFQRGIIYFNELVSFDSISLENLKEKHLAYLPNAKAMRASVAVTIDKFFNMKENNKIVFQVTQSAAGLLTQNHLNDNTNYTKIILHQTIKIGDTDSIALEFWMQLTMLNNIKTDIINYQESNDVEDLVYNVASFRNTPLTTINEQILEIITAYVVEDSEDSGELDLFTVVEKANSRRETSVTDQLWTALKWCRSYNDLLEAFQYLFSVISKHNVVNMPTSKTRLAVLIRDISDQRLAIPSLKGTEPMELLIEIGLEKITKDFEYIFALGKLCTDLRHIVTSDSSPETVDLASLLHVRQSLAKVLEIPTNNCTPKAAHRQTQQRKTLRKSAIDDKLNQHIGVQNSVFNLHDIDYKLSKLGQIYLVLEHLLLIESTLNMGKLYGTFMDDLQKPAKPFDVLAAQKTETREIPIDEEKILSKIENITPDRLRVTMATKNSYRNLKNIFYFSSEPIFPPSVFQTPEFEGIGEQQYYSHQLLHIDTPKS